MDERPAKRARSSEPNSGGVPTSVQDKPPALAAAATTAAAHDRAGSATGVTTGVAGTAPGGLPAHLPGSHSARTASASACGSGATQSVSNGTFHVNSSNAGSSRPGPPQHVPHNMGVPAPGVPAPAAQAAPGSLQWLLQRQQQLQAVATVLAPIPDWAQAALDGLDAFWVPTATLAVLVTQPTGPCPGSHGQLQCVSALFTVSPAALADMSQRRAQARLVCVQPDDSVAGAAGPAAAGATAGAAAPTRRIHMYGGSHVVLNGRPYEVTKEDRVDLLLEPNQADQAVDLSSGLRAGVNQLSLFWPVGVAGAVAVLRLCRGPLTVQEVLAGSGPSRLAPPLPLPQLMQHLRAWLAPVDMEADDGERQEAEQHKQEEAERASEKAEAQRTAGTEPGRGAASPEKGPHGGPEQAGRGPCQPPPQAPSPSSPAAAAPGTANGTVGAVGADTNGLVSISLRCPLGGGVVGRPGHLGATAATHPLAFFDLAVFLEQARATGSWACPATGTLGSVHDLRPHAYLTEVVRTLDANGVPRGKVEAIDVLPCGRWRPRDSRVPFLEVTLPPAVAGAAAAAVATGAAGAPAGGAAGSSAHQPREQQQEQLPPPPRFDVRLLDPEEEEGKDVVDLTDD